jgi:hypothetical protein
VTARPANAPLRRAARRALGLAAGVALALAAAGALAQDEDDEGLQQSPGDPQKLVLRAVDAMGGLAAVRAIGAAALDLQTSAAPDDGPTIRERHTLRVDGRLLHYASRQPDGVGFDLVVARTLAFVCDRGPDGKASYVEDLSAEDAREGAYERDMLFLPLLLPTLALDPRAQLDHRGKTSLGEEVVRAVIQPAEGNPGAAPFIVRLRFDPASGALTGAMGTIPCGQDRGKKRYLTFRDPTRTGALLLPRAYVDQRDKDEEGRELAVTWTLDPPLTPDLFERPAVPAAEAAPGGR